VLHVFDVEARTFPPWAKALCDNLPETFTSLKPGLEGLFFMSDPSHSDRHYLLTWGWNWLCKIDLSGPTLGAEGNLTRNRRHLTSGSSNFSTTFIYRQILYVGHLGGNEVVVIERPLLDILSGPNVPPPYHKRKYNT
jgi:U3 small nucleolar RNA-associated protein 4